MSRVRRAPKQLKSSVKIHILCEGETEEAHLGKILSSYRNVSIECFGGGDMAVQNQNLIGILLYIVLSL